MSGRGLAGHGRPHAPARPSLAVVGDDRWQRGDFAETADNVHRLTINAPPRSGIGHAAATSRKAGFGSPNFESVRVEAGSSFRSFGLPDDMIGRDHDWHYHPELELVWVRRGKGTRFIGDSIEPYEDGDIVLIGANLPHCYHQTGAVAGDSAESAAVVVQFRPETFDSALAALAELRPVRVLLNDAKYGLHVGGQAAERVRALMRKLPESAALPRLIGLIEILDVLTCAGGDLRRLASADYDISDDLAERNRRRIETVHDYVRQNLAYGINQAEAARLTGLTPSAFSRFFRKMTGQTFVRFVNSVRIAEACRLLAETNECVTEIAFSCGYWSIANFNRQFAQFKGMNPTRFREHRSRIDTARSLAG
jgi:AraC-like DNA-binding protein/mannose-6-phosphate isomerase-like protein (cupin superfamily)